MPAAAPDPNKLFRQWKEEVRNILTVSKTGVEIRSLEQQLEEFMGKLIPAREMGFPTVGDFLYECRDILDVHCFSHEDPSAFRTRLFLFIKASAVEDVEMHKLVAGQEKAKTKRRNDGTTNHPTRAQVRRCDAKYLKGRRGTGGVSSLAPPTPSYLRNGGGGRGGRSSGSSRSSGYPPRSNQSRTNNGYYSNSYSSSGLNPLPSAFRSQAPLIPAHARPPKPPYQPPAARSTKTTENSGRRFHLPDLDNDYYDDDDDDDGFDFVSGGKVIRGPSPPPGPPVKFSPLPEGPIPDRVVQPKGDSFQVVVNCNLPNGSGPSSSSLAPPSRSEPEAKTVPVSQAAAKPMPVPLMTLKPVPLMDWTDSAPKPVTTSVNLPQSQPQETSNPQASGSGVSGVTSKPKSIPPISMMTRAPKVDSDSDSDDSQPSSGHLGRGMAMARMKYQRVRTDRTAVSVSPEESERSKLFFNRTSTPLRATKQPTANPFLFNFRAAIPDAPSNRAPANQGNMQPKPTSTSKPKEVNINSITEQVLRISLDEADARSRPPPAAEDNRVLRVMLDGSALETESTRNPHLPVTLRGRGRGRMIRPLTRRNSSDSSDSEPSIRNRQIHRVVETLPRSPFSTYLPRS